MPQIPAQPLATPRFRLVGRDDAQRTASPTQHRATASRIAHENQAAATLSPFDARLIFAQQVAANLEGGRAAILRPDRRQSLITQAKRLGLRAFDANLVIAIVQDATQASRVAIPAPNDPHLQASLSMVRRPGTQRGERQFGTIAITLLLASVLLVVLIFMVY